MSKLDCNVVVITGAANGIGKELARRFAARGSKLALTDIDGKHLERLESELRAKGSEVYTEVFDISDYAAVEKFSANVFKRFGSIDILFNNAGVFYPSVEIERLPTAEWEATFHTNITAAFG